MVILLDDHKPSVQGEQGMMLRWLMCCLAFMGMMPAGPAVAQDAALKAAEARLERSFNGVVLATRGDEILYHKAFGVADAQGGAPITTDMNFRIGSISKTVTAAIANALAAEGKLSLDDPLSKYFPHIANADRIQIRHLIEHRSGLGDFSQKDWRRLLLGSPAIRSDGVISMIMEHKPRSEPGAKFAYNNSGYVILGQILEQASGKTYPDLVRDYGGQIGFPNARFAAQDRDIPKRARGHGPNLKPDESGYNYAAIAAAGGLYATASDLASWCGTLDRADSFLAWRSGERFGRKAHWHTGNTNDFSALLVRFPDIDGCYVVLSNVGRTAPPKDIIRTLPELFFGVRRN
jgi:CubicO group peptidase (beta-lactamase class C family)